MNRWGELATPVDALETLIRARAQSLMTEAGKPAPFFPIEQAREIVRQHEEQLQKQRQRPSLAQRVRSLFTPAPTTPRIDR